MQFIGDNYKGELLWAAIISRMTENMEEVVPVMAEIVMRRIMVTIPAAEKVVEEVAALGLLLQLL